MQCRRGLAMRKLSVRLSNARIVTKPKKDLDRFFLRFVTIHAFDGQADRRTDRQADIFLATRLPCIQCRAVLRLYLKSKSDQ